MARYSGPPMTLGNMRANGVRMVTATCLATGCGHSADIAVDSLDDAAFVPEIGRRMRCTACGGRRVEARPAWHTAKRPGMG